MTKNAKDSVIKDVGKFKEHFSNLTVSPGIQVDPKALTKLSVKRLASDEKVSRFEDSFKVWNIEYAQLLAHGENGKISYAKLDASSMPDTVDAAVNDSGYALLNLLNPYIEVIGRLCGDYPNFPYWVTKPKECISEGKFVETGIIIILPELKNLEARKRKGVITLFRIAVRNSMAHTYFTGTNVILSRSHEQVILVGTLRNKRAISINPQTLFDRVNEHFTDYLRKLRMPNPSNEVWQLQERFNERYPFGLKLCKDRKK